MAKARKKTDSTRASRDGHEFHEAWVARKAMQLLLPASDLAGMAVEGLSPSDQENASSETVCVADLTLYYGEHPSFADSRRTKIVQFKYSVAGKDSKFRARDAEKTVKKFADTYRDFKKRHGSKEVREKLRFQLITNRLAFPALTEAISGLAKKTRLTGEAKKQADQFKRASLLDDEQLAEFAGKFSVAGLAGNLGDIKNDLSNILVDWSATRDAVASSRLGKMRDMVRGKAGSEGEGKNVITRMDVLATLGIAHEEELLPCPPNLPEVGEIVERGQLATALELIPELSKPLLVNAAGGMGKTVFIQSLAEKLEEKNEVIFFDCFAGGAYRSPGDSRHLPEKGLVHIANELACRGLCDPIIPGGQDLQSLLRTFLRRLEQSVGTIAKTTPGRNLLLFLDAIDNAELIARKRGEKSFPSLLLETFEHNPPKNVKLIASSRSHRIPVDPVLYKNFELSAFSDEETKTYIGTRILDASNSEVQVAQARSKGNPRVLDYLVKDAGSRLVLSEIDKEIELDQLIQSRIDAALSNAVDQGYERNDTASFLAGLAVLPLPVPAEEYAKSQGIEEEAVKSFASDMYPLLEITEQGLTFRDEPTETLIIEKYGSSKESLKRTAENLLNHQEQSVYAARALPELLYRIGDGGRLFDLALDEETFPETVTGTVGRRNIRYARIKTALRYATDRKNYNRLVRLLVETATITSADQHGTEYILDHPDLVTAAKDVDAARKLFEVGTNKWQGTRDARLTIANALHGDLNEARRHAENAEDWINHWYRQPEEEHPVRPGRDEPKHLDVAAIPFVWAAEGDLQNAARFMNRWKDWYSYEVWEHVLAFSSQAGLPEAATDLPDQMKGDIAGLTAALSFVETDRTSREKLVGELAETCDSLDELEFNTDESWQGKRRYNFAEGLCKACGIALSLESRRESLSMLRLMSKTRPGMWAFFRESHSSFTSNIVLLDVVLFLLRVALTAAAEGKEIREKDVMPEDLISLCGDMEDDVGDAELRDKLESKTSGPGREKTLEARQFLSDRLNSLLSLVKALSRLLAAPEGKADNPFTELLTAWADSEKTVNRHGTEEFSLFFQILGRKISTFALWTRGDLGDASAEAYIKRLHEREPVEAAAVIEAAGILAKRRSTRKLAGAEAVKACPLIEREDDVRNRAYFYAELARAILPASSEEAATYFRRGLEEMDAVGSDGDYFVNELLLFAASLKGGEIDEKHFHNLTNICELNIPDEPEKFFWSSFGQGLSRVAGCRGLAKLFRWNDRSKAPLSFALQPYLTALILHDKIEPEDAVALNRLSYPEEFSRGCNTETLATAIRKSHHENPEELVSEVVRQFEENRQGTLMFGLTDELASVVENVLGKESETADYIARSRRHFEQVFRVRKEYRNYRDEKDEGVSERYLETQRRKEQEVAEIVAGVDPADTESFEKAIDDFVRINNFHHYPYEEFFGKIREKIPYRKRTDYLRMLAEHETLDFYGKLEELEKCGDSWKDSSASIADEYKKLGIPTTLRHADDLARDGQLSGHYLKRISEISRVSIHKLALELVKKFAGRKASTTREVWISLAELLGGKARKKESRKALVRLLKGPAAKLSHKASDGEWREGLYPNENPDIFSGMVWRKLGSPDPEDRWRAAHSARCFARFERWEVLDALVDKIDRRDAGAFQAAERPFYFMHAKLWLLIALARIALDEPKAAARYRDVLLKTALDEEAPHVLTAHFAAEAIRACVKAKEVDLSDGVKESLSLVNKSPFPRLRKKIMQRQSKSLPESDPEFFLGSHFYRHDVESLGRVFGKPGREVRKTMSETVQSADPSIKSMRDFAKVSGLSTSPATGGPTRSPFQTYGWHLVWHARFMAAGRLLRKYPVTDDCSLYDDPWNAWLRAFLLTREDGLWLSDGIDRAPLNALPMLLERNDAGFLILTEDESKILELLNIESGVLGETVVAGEWDSGDRVSVHVESALVKPENVRKVATQLYQEDRELAWLPNYCSNEYDGEYKGSDKDDCEPWIVWPGDEARLDKDDPLGSVAATRRLRIAQKFLPATSLKRKDPFGRVWENGRITARSVAWGHEIKGDYEEPRGGSILMCSKPLLEDLLSGNGTDLLLLIKLRRHEKVYGRELDSHPDKTAVVRIKRTLEAEVMPQDAQRSRNHPEEVPRD